MASTTEDGAFPVHVPADKLTLYLAKKGARVLRVTFHDTSSWCHEITWICTLIPDKYSPYINHHKFRQQLPALREQFATHGRLTSIQIDQWMFVFGHDTEDTAWEMMTGYGHIKDIILKFLHEIHAQVTDIEMESVIKKVDAPAARKDQETLHRGTTDQDVLFSSKHEDDVDAPHLHPQERHDDVPHAQGHQDASHPYVKKDEDASHLTTGSVTKTGMSGNSRADKSVSAGQINTNAINQDNRTVNSTIIINLPSGKAVCESCWKAKHENIPQPTDIDIETVKTLLNELFPESLTHIRWECMVFCFEHESMEDAMGMIVQHADIKEDILHFLQELDPSIDDIVMEVEVRELCESEEQTAETSETRPLETADPEHKDEGGASRSHPQQRDDDETCYPHIKDKDDSHLHPQKMYVKDTSHSHPLTTYEKGTFKNQPIGIKKGIGSHSSGYTSSDPSLKPLVKGQDSDRRASSDPSQGHSQSERYPWLSTASHATPSRADLDLYFASGAGDLEKVKRLLSTPGVNVDCRVRWWSQTPVMEAADRGHRDVVELLVSEGADVSLVNEYGDNILHLACWGGDVETVKYVLSLNVVDINSRGRGSRTPVMEAAWREHREMVELLVSKGADVSLVDESGYNILHLACMRGHVETVEYVLSLNVVDINSRGVGSRTPVMEAAWRGHREMVELLVNEGADVSLVDKYGDKTLHYACRGGDLEMVKFVLSLNVVDIDARNNRGETAADVARLWRRQPVVELLKSRGAQ